MITVEEVWPLAPGVDAAIAMQAIEDVVGPIAHGHAGWCGHAMFLQQIDDPSHVIIIYPWRSVEAHEDLIEQEKLHLQGFYDKYCTGPRTLRYYTEIPHH